MAHFVLFDPRASFGYRFAARRGLGVIFQNSFSFFDCFGSSFELVARLRQDRDRSDGENHRKDNAAIAIDFLRPLLLLGVIEDDGRHNLDEGKENEQCAG